MDRQTAEKEIRTQIHKLQEEKNNLKESVYKLTGIARIMAMVLMGIGMVGAVITVCIDKIKGGSFNLPSDIGYLQITGECIFLFLGVLGLICLIALCDQSDTKI